MRFYVSIRTRSILWYRAKQGYSTRLKFLFAQGFFKILNPQKVEQSFVDVERGRQSIYVVNKVLIVLGILSFESFRESKAEKWESFFLLSLYCVANVGESGKESIAITGRGVF